MSDTENFKSINPYESTQTDLDEKNSNVAQGFFTPLMISHLKAASPWMKFLGIVGFVGAGLMILLGIGFLSLFPFLRNIILNEFSNLEFLATSFNSAFGFVYIMSGVIYIFPARFLYNFAAKINLFINMKNERAMEIALANNKSYWKFYGICVIISLAFIPLAIIISIVAAVGSVL
jgi:hypothetical protein